MPAPLVFEPLNLARRNGRRNLLDGCLHPSHTCLTQREAVQCDRFNATTGKQSWEHPGRSGGNISGVGAEGESATGKAPEHAKSATGEQAATAGEKRKAPETAHAAHGALRHSSLYVHFDCLALLWESKRKNPSSRYAFYLFAVCNPLHLQTEQQPAKHPKKGQEDQQ